jgi:hypothetical protein
MELRKTKINAEKNTSVGDAKKSPPEDLGVQSRRAATRNPVEALRYE